MKLTIISLQPLPPPASPHLFLRCSSWGVHNVSSAGKKGMRAVPARDRVIDFGKHKGKMLGMLSSEYLRWMSKNLRAGDFEEWAKLAEQVLEDEIYGDRLDWEQAERILSGEAMVRWGRGVTTELEEMSKRFGWDNDDKVGWSKVDFGLLGTSKGGRIPRIHGKHKEESNLKKPAGKVCSSGDVGRQKRRERAAKKREQQATVSSRSNEEQQQQEGMNHDNNNGRKGSSEEKRRSPFPGRQSLVKKVLHRYTYQSSRE